MIVNTVRMVDNDQVKEFSSGDENSLKENLALGFVNPIDYKKLNLTPSLNLKLTSEYGQVVVEIKEDKNVPAGTILMPVSIWANQITGMEAGNLIFKNIKIQVEITKEAVLEFKELLELIKN